MGYELWFGVAKVDITPEVPVPLAGFAFRSGPYEGITRPLYAKVSLFQQKAAADQPVATTLVVQADLIALGSQKFRVLPLRLNSVMGYLVPLLFITLPTRIAVRLCAEAQHQAK